MKLFQGAGMDVKVLPPAVDSNEFYQATDEEKREFRLEFNVPEYKTIVLHVFPHNQAAKALYGRAGFETTERDLMRKSIG